MANAKPTICFVGGGNMGAAFASGLVSESVLPAEQILIVEPDQTRAATLTRDLGVRVTPALEMELSAKDVLVAAIKPQLAIEVLSPLSEKVASDTAIVSIMAGFSIASLEQIFPENKAILRAMPNLPARQGKGVTAYYTAAQRDFSNWSLVEAVLNSVGTSLAVNNEELVDAATAVSGSGPAYFFYLVEAIEAAAIELGFSSSEARLLAEETFNGASALLAASDASAADLRKQVTSKGGTTAAATESLDAGNVKELVSEAVMAAFKRARELRS